ncbi:MAG: ABC transporter permease [Acidobacteria bacterium]|nr:ABC transporter permease [Acidobacteriota bacterium]MBI3423620.1 ABC transporter permease [Acidobacteriota bacterium]
MSVQHNPATSSAPALARNHAEMPVYDSARRSLPLIDEFKELVRYRDLLTQLIARNIKTRYKRSVLGILWTMLNPLLMMLVLTFVFSEVFRFSTKNYAVYALAGLSLWNFFAQTTTGAMSELIWGGGLLNRIYIPRAIFAASALGTGLVNLLLSLLPLFVIMVITGVPVRPTILILPIPIILTAMFSLGVALILSRLAAYFADVVEMYQILLLAWMYLTPVIYPKEIIPGRLRWLFNLNPMFHLIEIFRAPLFIGWLAGPKTVAAATLAAFVTLAFGWWYFSRKADELAYRI